MLAISVAMAATPALAEGCQAGSPQHHKGPLVFMDYDQLELDASYDQVYCHQRCTPRQLHRAWRARDRRGISVAVLRPAGRHPLGGAGRRRALRAADPISEQSREQVQWAQNQ